MEDFYESRTHYYLVMQLWVLSPGRARWTRMSPFDVTVCVFHQRVGRGALWPHPGPGSVLREGRQPRHPAGPGGRVLPAPQRHCAPGPQGTNTSVVDGGFSAALELWRFFDNSLAISPFCSQKTFCTTAKTKAPKSWSVTLACRRWWTMTSCPRLAEPRDTSVRECVRNHGHKDGHGSDVTLVHNTHSVLQPQRFWPRSPTARQWTAGLSGSSHTSCEWKLCRTRGSRSPECCRSDGSLLMRRFSLVWVFFVFSGYAGTHRFMKKVSRSSSPKSWRQSTSSIRLSGTTSLNLVTWKDAVADIRCDVIFFFFS